MARESYLMILHIDLNKQILLYIPTFASMNMKGCGNFGD